jgi:hypothetical protein
MAITVTENGKIATRHPGMNQQITDQFRNSNVPSGINFSSLSISSYDVARLKNLEGAGFRLLGQTIKLMLFECFLPNIGRRRISKLWHLCLCVRCCEEKIVDSEV